jgi:hypothetical protein
MEEKEPYETGQSEVTLRVAFGGAEVTPGPGGSFDVTLFRAGQANGYTYPVAVLEASVPLWDGATSFVDHATWDDLSRGRSVRDICGVVSAPRFETEPAGDSGTGRIRAQFRPAGPDGPFVEAVIRQLLADKEAGLPIPNVGLSADITFAYKIAVGNRSYDEAKVATNILKVHSVDVVFDPAAGGVFERVLNSVNRARVAQGGKMTEAILQSQAKEPNTGEGAGQGSGPDPGGRQEIPTQVVAELARQEQEARAAALRQSEALLRAQCASTLNSVLSATDLPPPFLDHLRAQFAEQVFTPADLNAAIEAQRGIWAKLAENRVIKGVGRVEMADEMDRLRLAVDHLFGLPTPAGAQFEKLSGIRELYLMLTGDREFVGAYHPERVQFANASTSTMAELVRNVMNKSVLAQYEKLGLAGYLWWRRIAHEEDFSTMQQVSWITVGGFANLPTVNEGADYTELTWDDARETADWAKKGGYIGLTLEMLDRDDTAKVKSLPQLLATAAVRTVATLVSNLFTVANGTASPTGYGPTLADGGALFNATAVGTGAGHGNLGSTALSASQWDTVLQAIFKQPELNSSKRLGVRPRFLLVPIELEKLALTIFLSEGEPGTGDNDVNVRRGAADDVIVVPEWTDANDWGAVADPAIAPGIAVGYRFGREPEVFVASDPLTGSMFTNDEMRLKVRFLVAVNAVNWRPMYFSHV